MEPQHKKAPMVLDPATDLDNLVITDRPAWGISFLNDTEPPGQSLQIYIDPKTGEIISTVRVP